MCLISIQWSWSTRLLTRDFHRCLLQLMIHRRILCIFTSTSHQRSVLHLWKCFHFLSKVLKMKKHQIFRTLFSLVAWGMEASLPWGKVCKQIKMCIEEATHTSRHQPNTQLFCDTSVYLAPLKSHACLQQAFYVRREIVQYTFPGKRGVLSLRKPHW